MDRIQLTIPAIDARPGDLVDLPVEMNYTVRVVTRAPIADHTPADVREQGGWVVLAGDTEDGYYAQYYGGEQEYNAAPDQEVTVLRTVAGFVPLNGSSRHDHSATTGIIGYVVRETIREGVVLREGNHVGVDVRLVLGGPRYADALVIRDGYRDTRSGYAVVDNLYGCGCRGGIF